MRAWQVERRKRTRHLIELGGLVVKARVADLTGDDRAIILGALLWMADKLQSDQGELARVLWAAKGKEAFAVERATDAPPSRRKRRRIGHDRWRRRGDTKYRSAGRHRAAWRRRESHRRAPAAPCADLCQQLLFKGVNRRGVPLSKLIEGLVAE